MKCSHSKFCLILAVAAGVCSASAQPVNDNFANRAAITGETATVSGSLQGATSEAGEPLVPGVSSGQTAWWTWTAPSNGIVTLSVHGTNFSPFLTVYSGADFGGLSLVASNSYFMGYANPFVFLGITEEYAFCQPVPRYRSEASFHVVQGQAYQISVDSGFVVETSRSIHPVLNPETQAIVGYRDMVLRSTNSIPGSDFQFAFQLTPAPTNDDFEDATLITGARKKLLVSNAGATKQAGEPDHLSNPGGSSVWFTWKAPASGRVALTTNNLPPYASPDWWGFVADFSVGGTVWPQFPDCGIETNLNPLPNFFPLFSAYTGNSVDSLVPAGTLPMNLPDYTNGVTFDVIKGQTYHIAYDGNLGATAQTPLYLALTQPAVNDNFKKRIKMSGIYIRATGFNAGATREPGEPVTAGSNEKSVWWSWKAPVSGPVSIDLTNSDYTFPVQVFTGTSVSNLTPIASGTGGVLFDAVQGQVYHIAVCDFAGLTGAIQMKLEAQITAAQLVETRTCVCGSALLTYAAAPGQKLLLQRWDYKHNVWLDVRTSVAHQNGVTFKVKPSPAADGPMYRAVIIDQVP